MNRIIIESTTNVEAFGCNKTNTYIFKFGNEFIRVSNHINNYIKLIADLRDQSKTITEARLKKFELKYLDNTGNNNNNEEYILDTTPSWTYQKMLETWGQRNVIADKLEKIVECWKALVEHQKSEKEKKMKEQYGTDFISQALNSDDGFEQKRLRFNSRTCEIPRNALDDELYEDFFFNNNRLFAFKEEKKGGDKGQKVIEVIPITPSGKPILPPDMQKMLIARITKMINERIIKVNALIQSFRENTRWLNAETEEQLYTFNDLMDDIAKVVPSVIVNNSSLCINYIKYSTQVDEKVKTVKRISEVNFVNNSGDAWSASSAFDIVKDNIVYFAKDKEILSNDPKEDSIYCIDLNKYPAIEIHNTQAARFYDKWFDGKCSKLEQVYLCAFVWKCCYKNAVGRQALVLCNPGRCGTTLFVESISRMLYRSISRAISETTFNGDFGLARTVGTRLVNFKDVQKVKDIIDSSNFRSLVCNEEVEVNMKNAQQFGYIPNNNIILTANKQFYVNHDFMRTRLLPIVFKRNYDVNEILTQEEVINSFLEIKNEFLSHCHWCYSWLKSHNLMSAQDFIIANDLTFEYIDANPLTKEQMDKYANSFAGWTNCKDFIVCGRNDEYGELEEFEFESAWMTLKEDLVNECQKGLSKNILQYVMKENREKVKSLMDNNDYVKNCGIFYDSRGYLKNDKKFLDFFEYIKSNYCQKGGDNSAPVNRKKYGKVQRVQLWDFDKIGQVDLKTNGANNLQEAIDNKIYRNSTEKIVLDWD